MTITWKDPNIQLHGKQHKHDNYYFRHHYGKQRIVFSSYQYIDNPTKAQKTAREQFTELRREVARQLKDPILRAKWERKFKANNQGYKMLHTYVYAMLKKGESVISKTLPKGLYIFVTEKNGKIKPFVITEYRNNVTTINQKKDKVARQAIGIVT